MDPMADWSDKDKRKHWRAWKDWAEKSLAENRDPERVPALEELLADAVRELEELAA